jgi:hypothetical protein
MVKAKAYSPVSHAVPKTKRQAAGEHHNSNVFKILPVTTLRTIDLGGKKNSDPLFSRFCGKLSVFFEGILAPQKVQSSHKQAAQILSRESSYFRPFTK